MAKILIVEDDKALNEGIHLTLRQNEWEFIQAYSLLEAREYLKRETTELIILDINLPDGSGLDLLKEVKEVDPNVKIILLTANQMEIDIVTGLESGADDYITKPFSLMVLRARVKVQLRNQKEIEDIFQQGHFYFDFQRMIFRVEGHSVELSKTEQKLLHLFIKNLGRTLTRELLIDRVWDGDSEFVDGHTLTVSIKRLRKKLEDHNQQIIKTVYGVGYKFVIEEGCL